MGEKKSKHKSKDKDKSKVNFVSRMVAAAGSQRSAR